MKRLNRIWWAAVLVAFVAAGTFGCSGAAQQPGVAARDIDPSRDALVSGTGPESRDVLVVADQMLRSMLGAPAIAGADRPPTVVLLEFRNHSRFPIDGQLFLRKLRAQLNSEAGGRMLFLARERMEAVQAEREAKREGELSADPARRHAAPAGADYFLTGELRGLAKRSRAGRSDYMFYSFALIDTESSAVVWEDEFEVKRVGREDPVYR